MGIFDWLLGRKKKDKTPKGKDLHQSRVDYYSTPGTFDVSFKRRKGGEPEKRGKVVSSSDDFDPKNYLYGGIRATSKTTKKKKRRP